MEVEKFKCNIKNRAKLSYDKPSQIFAEVVSDLPDDILMNIPHESAVKRVVQKQRNSLNPLKPTSLEDLKIEGDWSLYEGRQFLIHDNMDLNHERVIIFVVDEGLQILTEASTWYCDGNFNLSPEYFQQLYVIRVPKNDFFYYCCILFVRT